MFSLVGPFDARRAEELRLLMIEATGPRIRQEVMLDVSRVSLDSAVTVDSLAWLSRELTTSGRKLILVGQTPAAERQMEGAAVHDAGAAGADRGEAPVVYAPSGNIAPGFASELIHRIFGTGLRLAGIRSLVCDGPATEELAGVIEDLDSIIKEIRTAAFVHRGTEEQGGGRNEAGNEDPWPEGPGS